MGKGKNLKAALQSQQSRFKANEKLSHTARILEQKTAKNAKHNPTAAIAQGKGKPAALPPPRRRTIPFRATDKILLVGEGNFSFARALLDGSHLELRSFPPCNLTATAYDSEQECYAKYTDARGFVAALREKGVEVLFGVDATRLEKTSKLKGRKWDRVVWNFPHIGRGITDQDRNILSNQMLILGFLRSVSKVLASGAIPSFVVPKKGKKKEDEDDEDTEVVDVNEYISTVVPNTRGTILITLRNVPPYTLWDVPRLAKKPPLPTTGSTPPNPRYTLLRSFRFDRGAYVGYEHRMTKGTRAHGTGKTGEGGEDRTWEFCLQDQDSQ